MMPTPSNVRFFESAAELRVWFEANHDAASELWVGGFRKDSGTASVTALEIIEQSLCFGWVDSVRYPYGEGFAQRITPRRKQSNWSHVNLARYRDLEKRGLIHPRGREVFEGRDPAHSGIDSFENRTAGLDKKQLAKFRRRKNGWKFFVSQPPWYRRTAAYWVISAKREETRERRLNLLIEASRNGERIPPLRRPQPRSPSRAS